MSALCEARMGRDVLRWIVAMKSETGIFSKQSVMGIISGLRQHRN